MLVLVKNAPANAFQKLAISKIFQNIGTTKKYVPTRRQKPYKNVKSNDIKNFFLSNLLSLGNAATCCMLAFHFKSS
jgi:hypothetical protein